MSCKKCEKNPTFHSFEFLARLDTGQAIYHTSPSNATERQMNDQSIKDYVAHMDEASSSSWIWIVDCKGLESYHFPSLSVLQKFITIIQERYKFVLHTIYIINTNWKINIILSLAWPFIQESMKKRLIVVNSLLDLENKEIQPMIHRYIQ